MILDTHPKKGQTLSNGYTIVKITSKVSKHTGRKLYSLLLQKENNKRVSNYNPRKKEVSTFCKVSSSFNNSSVFKTW